MDKYNLEEGDLNDNRKSIVEQFTPHPDFKEIKERCSSTVKCLISGLVFFIIGLALGIVIGYLVVTFTSGKPEETTTVTETSSSPPMTVPVVKLEQKPKCKNKTVTVTREVVKQIPCRACAVVNPEINPPWSKKTLFAPLSDQEMSLAYKFLLKKNIIEQFNEQNKLELKSRYVTGMSLAPPVKTEALKHLDLNGAFPGRFAIARVVHGTHTPPYVAEYKVGPLDMSSPDSMTAVQVRSISFDKRPRDNKEYTLLYYFVLREFKKLNNISVESFDGATVGSISRVFVFPASRELHHERESYAFLGLVNDIITVDILPISAVISHRSTNQSEWTMFDFYYGNQGPFRTAEDLMNAYNSGTIAKITFPKGYRARLNRSFARNDSEPYREKAQVYPPKQYEPEGSRFTLDGHRVKWMGWSLEVNTHDTRGPGIYDVRFKGERIVYENSLNDLTLVYSSSSIGAGLTAAVVADILLGLGRNIGFIPGIDCPERARYLPSTYWNEQTQTAQKTYAICIFEVNSERPIWRHKSAKEGGLNDNHLVLRTVLNLGNYDYIIDFQFYLDGTMKTLVSSTGTIFTSFWSPENDTLTSGATQPWSPFGFRVSEFNMGSIHDHTFAFKLDLDIVDRTNSFEQINWKSGDYAAVITNFTHRTDIANSMLHKNTRYLDYSLLETEAGLVKDLQKPAFWTVVNRNLTNRWGAKRGYRIISTASHAEVLPRDHPVMKSLSYMKYHCAVTKHKDSEDYVSHSLYDLHGLNDPIQTLDDYIDGENITNADIVTWITLQSLHVPTSEDVPVTTVLEEGFVLRPFNFFDSTETFDMPQYMKVRNDVTKPYSTQQCHENQQYL